MGQIGWTWGQYWWLGMGIKKEKTGKDAIICQPSQGDQYKQGPKHYKDCYGKKIRKEVRHQNQSSRV